MSNLPKILSMIDNDAVRAQLVAAAADGVDVPKLLADARVAVGASSALQECSASSIVQSLAQAAQAGLRVNVGGEAYLVPFKGRCTLIAGWRGLLKLANRSPKVVAIDVQAVYAGEPFDVTVTADGPVWVHRPDPFNRTADRPVIGVYAYCRLVGGGVLFEAMSVDEVDSIRARAASSKGSSPWDTDWVQMALKTVLRRLLKRVPTDDEGARRIEAALEGDVVIDGIAETPRRRPSVNAARLASERAERIDPMVTSDDAAPVAAGVPNE